ncbi:hypothetical protein OC834_005761 [Tilletia horrida]|uniref:Uncharacterized protein n=1 Tax=Tilletia horrida TaxID=155126 RepID=A0AAN6GEJ4_9BASI|nr:hypothetical protein OC834_005761 [Tilletia horrida]KAK0532653.1 hypothetical protein OC842_003230 [Tilletia horrida]KAK0562524.1 hypothetical protein OC844_002673 [Tilletia horrida]
MSSSTIAAAAAAAAAAGAPSNAGAGAGAGASSAGAPARPFNASEVTQWLNGRFRAIEAEALNPSLPPEARPEILKVPKPAGGATPQGGGAGAWGGSKKQATSFVTDIVKAAQAAGSSKK